MLTAPSRISHPGTLYTGGSLVRRDEKWFVPLYSRTTRGTDEGQRSRPTTSATVIRFGWRLPDPSTVQ